MSDLEEDGGLFSIAISDSEDESQEKAKPRDHQTEEQFRALKATYKPHIEDGELWRRAETKLPLQVPVSKPDVQELMHAIEELYFFRRFAEGAGLARKVLDTSADSLDDEHRTLFSHYEEKCLKRSRGQEVLGGSL